VSFECFHFALITVEIILELRFPTLDSDDCCFVVNGMGGPGVLPSFTAIGLGAPALTNAYGSGIPSLGAFALASSGALGSSVPGGLRGLSNVLLVSNLNEEVNQILNFHSIYN
jgi:hypothetical protein